MEHDPDRHGRVDWDALRLQHRRSRDCGDTEVCGRERHESGELERGNDREGATQGCVQIERRCQHGDRCDSCRRREKRQPDDPRAARRHEHGTKSDQQSAGDDRRE